MAQIVRYHVILGGSRTTVSMDGVLSALLSLHLCKQIDHAVVRQWCQEQIDADQGAFTSEASQRLGGLAVLEVAQKPLVEAYWDATDKKISKKRKRR